MNTKINILIVEDEIIIAKHIEQILLLNDFKLIKIASNYRKAIKTLDESIIDLVLCDVNLGEEKNGIDLLEESRKKNNIPFIFITAYNDSDTIKRINDNNVSYYITKPFTEKQLISTLKLVMENLPDKDKVTKREIEIIKLLSKGFSSKKIAEELFISFNTVEAHRKNMLKKLDCKNTTELVFTAASKKWI